MFKTITAVAVLQLLCMPWVYSADRACYEAYSDHQDIRQSVLAAYTRWNLLTPQNKGFYVVGFAMAAKMLRDPVAAIHAMEEPLTMTEVVRMGRTLNRGHRAFGVCVRFSLKPDRNSKFYEFGPDRMQSLFESFWYAANLAVADRLVRANLLDTQNADSHDPLSPLRKQVNRVQFINLGLIANLKSYFRDHGLPARTDLLHRMASTIEKVLHGQEMLEAARISRESLRTPRDPAKPNPDLNSIFDEALRK